MSIVVLWFKRVNLIYVETKTLIDKMLIIRLHLLLLTVFNMQWLLLCFIVINFTVIVVYIYMLYDFTDALLIMHFVACPELLDINTLN